MNYGELLGRALLMTLKHRTLWVMGFVVGLNSMAVGLLGGGGSPTRRVNIGAPSSSSLPPLLEVWGRWWERAELRGLLFVVFVAVVLLALVVFILSVIGRGGLIGGGLLAEANRQVTLGEMWTAGLDYFWRILSARLLLMAPLAAFFVITGCLFVPLLFAPFLGLLCLPPLTCVFGVFLIVAHLVETLAERGIVVDGLGVTDAYREGWEMLKANAGAMIVFILIMLSTRFVFGFVVVVLVGIAALPAMLGLDPENVNWLLVGSSAVLFLFLFPLAALINSTLTVWDFSVWTLAYRQLGGNRLPAAGSPYALA